VAGQSSEVRRARQHHLVDFDLASRRVWIGGQRLHHGATGAAFAAVGIVGIAARRVRLRECVPVALLGTVLMAHDWKDRGAWFRRGSQLDLPRNEVERQMQVRRPKAAADG
jgi:hypothetical protein